MGKKGFKYRFLQNFENNNYISSEDKAFLKKGKIWNDTLFFSEFLEYSIKKQNGYFDSVMTLTHSDVIFMNKEDEIKAQEEMENNPWIIRFRINDQGFIELVEE